MKQDTSWGEVAEWYNDVVEDANSFQNKILMPNLLRLLAITKGEKVLDHACGQGFFARAYAEAGANVVATDISPELISIGKQKGPETIDYRVAKGQELGFLTGGSIDKGSCVLALQNIKPYQEVLTEISRVLRVGGRFYLVLNHPAFRIPRASEWGYDEKNGIQYRRLDSYLSESRVEIVMDPGKTGREKTVSFHRPLQMYFKAFQKAGLAVTRLEEWTSHKESDSGPRAGAENRARSEFPLFMMIELAKI